MELLSAAQKYQMATALVHIRGSVAQQNLLPTRLEPALRIYALAQKYGLRQEALQTARTISKYPMTIEDFDKLDIMPGASLMNSGGTTKGFGPFLRPTLRNLESLVLAAR